MGKDMNFGVSELWSLCIERMGMIVGRTHVGQRGGRVE